MHKRSLKYSNTILPELTVTPRINYTTYTGEETNIPTIKEYINSRRDEARANALLRMQNDVYPTVPVVPTELGRIFKKLAGDWYDDKDIIYMFGKDKTPSTCISTVSSKYGRTTAGNKTFRDNYKDLGFIEIPESQRDHGDIIQTIGRRGVPSHAAMVSGFTRDGRMLIDESHGDITPETIEHDIDYFDTKPKLKRKYYYRFVGNKDDIDKWTKDYNNLYLDRRSLED